MGEIDLVTPGPADDVGRWEALAALFEGALAVPAAERSAWLRARCASPADLSEIESLLASRTTDAGALERVMAALGPSPGDWHEEPPRTRVGPYDLLREIGRGGMGVVYLARRADGVYQRQVALKLARTPVHDASLRARFLAERDILAGLAHPNIAPLFDGGVTDDGLPYFTMEYVEGEPVDLYCDHHRLDLRARVRVFLRICSAVAAAHRALVVHRDLKPTNVLVTAHGEVKLLDFGIAKLLAPDTSASRAATATESRLMTPAYASPEQVLGAPVSTATDVYALGLLFYELLCGRSAHRFERAAAAHFEDVVARVDPVPMADALVRAPAGPAPGADAIARARSTTVLRLGRQLRGDLARITTMALQKDPDRRYASAAHMAEDLERYLDGRPVGARGHSVAYRTVRFARRHRLALVAAVSALAALLAFLALTVQHARQMERTATLERQEAERAREVADFVVSLFEANDPNVVQNREAPIAQMLDNGLRRADALASQPQLQTRLLNAIGRVYFNMGRYDEAHDIATKALAASRRAVGERHPDVARDERLLGLALGMQGKQREAAERFRAALAIHREHPTAPAAETATDLHNLGYALTQAGEVEEGERHIAEALAIRRRVLPAGHEDIAMSVSGLAFVRGRQGRVREAVELYREALAARLAGLGERHPEVARARQNLASVLSTAGDLDEARIELGRALDGYRAVYGERHPSIAVTLNNIGNLESRRGRHQEAVRYFEQSFEMRRELLGPDHPSTLLAQSNLGAELADVGRLAEAEAQIRGVLSRLPASGDIAMGPSRPQTTANLANVLLMSERLEEAEAAAREAVALIAARPGNPLIEASVLATLGRVLTARGGYGEATGLLERALRLREERLGPDHPATVRTRGHFEESRRGLNRTARPAR